MTEIDQKHWEEIVRDPEKLKYLFYGVLAAALDEIIKKGSDRGHRPERAPPVAR